MGNSIWILETHKADQMFEELLKGVELIRKTANKEMEDLKKQIDIKPVQKFDVLFLDGLKVSTWKNSSWYSNTLYIRIDYSEECNKFLKTQGVVSDSNYAGYKTFGISEDGVRLANEFIDKLAQFDQLKHESNIEKCKSNNDIYTALMSLLDRIGISSKYYGYKTNRSSKKDWLYYNWQSEISAQIPRGYSDSRLSDAINKHKESVQKLYNAEIKKIEDEKKKIEAEQQEKLANKKLAILLAKYDLDIAHDWEDLLEKVINRNKYLYLAHYLRKNRGDWNDGCSYAETGLYGFEVETKEDQEIYDNIHSYIENWSDYLDGRCFRDCEYSYDVLYGMVAEQEPDLYKDYQTILENASDY